MYRSRWWLALALGAVLLAAGWWVRRHRVTDVVRLPDGSRITVRAVTFGTNHIHTFGRPGARMLAPLLPARLRQRLGVSALRYSTAHPSLMVWAELAHWQSGPPGNPRTTATVADGLGAEINPKYFDRSAYLRSNASLLGWCFENFPRRGSTIQFKLYTNYVSLDVSALASFTLRNPADDRFPAWTPAPTPVTNRQDVGDFILTRWAQTNAWPGIQRRMGASASPWKLAEFRVARGGVTDSDWRLAGLELSDASGNHAQATIHRPPRSSPHATRDELTCLFNDMVWPSESSCRLTAEFSRTAKFAANELWTAAAVPVPSATNFSAVPAKFAIHGVTLVRLGVHPAYSGPTSPYLIQANAEAIVTMLPPTRGVRVTLVSLSDDRGRAVRHDAAGGTLPNGETWFQLEVPEGARTLNFTFAVHRSQFVNFVVPRLP